MSAPSCVPTRHSRRLLLPLLAALLCLPLLSSARAEALTFGVSVAPFTGGWPEGMLTVSVPFHTYESNEGPIVFAGRLDVSAPLDFSDLPRFGLGATGTFTSHDMFQPFFGAGAALGWAGPDDERHLQVSPTLLLGLRVPLPGAWSVRTEAMVAPLLGRFTVGLGVDVALW